MAASLKRTYPNLVGKVHHDVVEQIRLLRDATYDLRDVQIDVLDVILTSDKKIDRDLVAGKPFLVIARQDVTGGRTITWSSKFKGTNLIVQVTTANTYTAVLFFSVSDSEALLIAWSSGGQL